VQVNDMGQNKHVGNSAWLTYPVKWRL